MTQVLSPVISTVHNILDYSVRVVKRKVVCPEKIDLNLYA